MVIRGFGKHLDAVSKAMYLSYISFDYKKTVYTKIMPLNWIINLISAKGTVILQTSGISHLSCHGKFKDIVDSQVLYYHMFMF